MRRLPALLLLLPTTLVAAVLAAAPADAGPPLRVDVHGFSPDSWGLRSYDCAGAPDDGTTYRLETTTVRTAGSGSLRVETGPDSVGGALYSSARYVRSLAYPVYAVGGTDPHARWHIEIGDDVLESDPIPIPVGSWTILDLAGTALHDGDWSGTIDGWIATHGDPDQWTGGLLTGGCLGSPQVQIDEPRNRWHVLNLEPSDWSTFTMTLPHGASPSSFPVYDESFDLVARVRHTDLETGVTTAVPGAQVELSRRYPDGRWRALTTTRTDDAGNAVFAKRAMRNADYRTRVSNAGRPTKVAVVSVPAYLDLARPRLNGKPCKKASYDGCAEQTMSGDTFTLSGRISPAVGFVYVTVDRAGTGTNDHRAKRATVDARGHWSVAFHVRSGIRYAWEAHAMPGSDRYQPSRSYGSLLTVR